MRKSSKQGPLLLLAQPPDLKPHGSWPGSMAWRGVKVTISRKGSVKILLIGRDPKG